MTDGSDAVQITRVLDAPPQRVWDAWTDPHQLARWWWPERFHTVYSVDLRQGGTYCFRSVDLPDVGSLCVMGTFLTVEPPVRLRYTWRWEGQEQESLVSVTFVDRGEKTEVRVLHEDLPAEQEREDHALGWSNCLDRLEALLSPAHR